MPLTRTDTNRQTAEAAGLNPERTKSGTPDGLYSSSAERGKSRSKARSRTEPSPEIHYDGRHALSESSQAVALSRHRCRGEVANGDAKNNFWIQKSFFAGSLQLIFFSHRLRKETLQGVASICKPNNPEMLLDEAGSSSTRTAMSWPLRMCMMTPPRAMIMY